MIHKEGYPTLVFGLVLSLIIFILVRWVYPGNMGILIGVIFLDILLMSFLLQFFRNPYRKIHEARKGILCPADGTVVVMEKTLESEFLKKEALQISVFMSPFNRHNNLNPINGFIREIKYHPGKFLVAFNPKSSTDNERCSFLYETDQKDLLVMRQIAGAVARRIVNYLKPDERVRAGEEMGFIKFGSRVDLFIPMDYEINIKLGDKVVAGQTLLAKKKER